MMTFSLEILIPSMLAAIMGLLYLVGKMQKESDQFISDLQSLLKQRTIAHNRAKAKLSMLQTRYERLQTQQTQALSVESSTGEDVGKSEEMGFSGLLAEAEFVEAKKQKIEELQNRIHAISSMEFSDSDAKL